MPRRRLPARLRLRPARGDRRATWVILDGSRELGTGAGATERGKAEAALQAYLAQSHRPPSGTNRPSELLCSEVMSAYLRELAPTRPSARWIADMAEPIIQWWGDKALSEIRGQSCRGYVAWRLGQRSKRTKKRVEAVSETTARHELGVLRAAVHYYHKEYGPLTSVPVVSMPAKAPQRENYFLTRAEIARRIRIARRRPDTHHLARLFLLGLYTGSRPTVMLRLRWLPSTDAGWVDLDAGVIYRQPIGALRTKKRAPPCRIHTKLLPHLRAWRRSDLQHGIVNVIHFAGQPISHCRNSWDSVREDSGAARRDGPHVLRHSAATAFMQAGVDPALIAGYLGMDVTTLMSTYAHHHPAFQAGIAQVSPGKRVNQERTERG